MKTCLIFLTLVIAVACYPVKNNHEPIISDRSFDNALYDTLIYKNEKILLMQRPLQEKYKNAEYGLILESEIETTTSNFPRFIVTYIIDNDEVFIKQISVIGHDISEDDMQARMKQVLGSEKNKSGYFPIDISGSFIGRYNAEKFPNFDIPYLIPGTGTVYKFNFNKGKLINVDDITKDEQAENDRLKKYFQSVEKEQ
ncbi:MAG: hypothetical protein PHR52_09930 [Fermentimonas sp.]|nr:hypothetical protein [Fermentimonas sp.]